MNPPQILLFGDSHTYAIQRAVERRAGKRHPVPLSAYRRLKAKNGINIGDTSLEDFLEIIGRLTADDVVISTIGGNQHAVFSTIQHPQPFDFMEPEGGHDVSPDAEMIPYRLLEELFLKGVRSGDGKDLDTLRKSTAARVVHVIPPPPKEDNSFIQQYHETTFATDGISSRGVSPAPLRLKFWRLQTRILQQICSEIGVDVMTPPSEGLDEQGFLAKDFYTLDATHANPRYGELILAEVERRYLPEQRELQHCQ